MSISAPATGASASTPVRVQRWAVLISTVLFVVKIVAWLLTGSIAILTDALESTVNVATGLIGWYSLYLSAKPRDREHPHGHGRVELISASIEGILIGAAGIAIVYEALHSLWNQHTITRLDDGIWLISATALVNYVLGAWCIRTAQRHQSIALKASGKHLQADTWTTVGIVLGLLMLRLTGWLWIDSAVALLFALMIIFEGYRILRNTIAGIMDEADEDLIHKMADILNRERQEPWVDLHHLRVIKYGSVLHMDAHLTLPWYFNVCESHEAVQTLHQTIKAHFDQPVEMFIHSDACNPPKACRHCTLTACAHRQAAFESAITWSFETLTDEHGSLAAADA